jgi:anti-sigma regulatory factor (Ser/Thr protein kinase)
MRPPDQTDHETGKRLALELQLQRNDEAPGVARAAVAGLCEDFDLASSLCYTAVLLVSELVTNAVRHSSGPQGAPIDLAVAVKDKTIRVTVTDAGHGFTPEPRDPLHSGGYGLYLLAKEASRWGVDRSRATCVWFELDLC